MHKSTKTIRLPFYPVVGHYLKSTLLTWPNTNFATQNISKYHQAFKK